MESVALKIVFRADKGTYAKLKQAVPRATFRRGNCEVKLEGAHPAQVAEMAKAVLEAVRAA